MVCCSSTARPGRSRSSTRHWDPNTASTLPTQIDALPSACVPVAASTGDSDIQLCETGKLNSIPNAAHAPRYPISAFLIDRFA